MEAYHRLTQAERYQIEALMQSGISIRGVAKIINRNPSTISRELERNRYKSKYCAVKAKRLCLKRRKGIGPAVRISEELVDHIVAKLQEKYSPQQISGELKMQNKTSVSHESIYKFIYDDAHKGGDLWKELRRGRKRRRSHSQSRMKETGVRNDRIWIDERPPIVEARLRLGDFERDTMEGKKKRPHIINHSRSNIAANTNKMD